MSNQSGIGASDELVEKFKSFTDGNDRTLVLYIDLDSEKVEAAHSLAPGPSGNFEDDFAALGSVLDPNEPRYIIHRLEDPSQHAFISFVPDNAHVRKKMVYASSMNTLQRQLGGSGRFPTTLFWTDLDEVTGAGWKQHTAHTGVKVPLTVEEAAERNIEEAVERDSMNTASAKRSHLVESDESVLDPSFDLSTAAPDPGSAHVLHINDAEKVVRHLSRPVANVSAIPDLIDDQRPQYTLYRDSGGQTHFVYTCPSRSSLRQKMIYAFKKEPTTRALKQHFDIDTVIEASDPSEVLELLTSQAAPPQASSGPKFARPRRPGKR